MEVKELYEELSDQQFPKKDSAPQSSFVTASKPTQRTKEIYRPQIFALLITSVKV
jgi:hypothetical protein